MSDHKIPYSVQAGMMSAVGNEAAVVAIIQNCLQDVSKTFMNDIIYKYDRLDLPFVLAAVKVTADSLESFLDNDDKEIYKGILSQTKCIAIDASELRRQAKEENNNG